MSRQSDKVQTERQVLQEWFDRLCECVPELPVNDTLRNNKLREDIFNETLKMARLTRAQFIDRFVRA